MPDYLVTLAVALFALVGTVAGVYGTHKRWRAERRSRFLDQRQAVYRELWDLTEALAVELRISELPVNEVDGRVQDLNVFMLKAGPFLAEEDRLLTQKYVYDVHHFMATLRLLGDPEALRFAQLTGTIEAPHLLTNRIRDEQQRALRARENLLTRIRQVLQRTS